MHCHRNHLERIQTKATIAEVTVAEASDLAVNLIEAATLTATDVPELNSIGGPVTAYLIDVKGIKPIK